MVHHAFAFNPLEYSHKLEQGGMDKKLADIQAQAQFEIVTALLEEQMVTKADIRDIRQDIKGVKEDIQRLETDLRAYIQTTQKDIVIKLGSIIGTGLTLLGVFLGILHFIK